MAPSSDRDDGRRSGFLTTLPAILTGIAAVLTAVAGLVAVFAAGGDERPDPTPTAVSTQVVASITATSTSTPEPTATAERTATPKRTATPRAAGDDWPPARSAYTVILASKTSRPAAEAVADEARGDLPDVGVLRSGDHPSLNAGYWVAYSGVIDSRSRASHNAEDARAVGFPAAYVRWVQGR